MGTKAAAVVVLVCPQCGKKYKGDANKPDARYQCPIDQSTLIRLDTEPALASKQERSPAPSEGFPGSASGQSDPGWNPAAAPGGGAGFGMDGERGSAASSSPYSEYIFGAGSPNAGGDIASRPAFSSPESSPASPDEKMPSFTPPEPRAEPALTQRQPGPPRPASKKDGKGGALSGFEARRSVVAALEKLGGTDSATGERLAVTKYEVKSKLGAGGMGEVYKVLDRDLRREVAMKQLRPGAGGLEEDMLRFIKEAQATGRLEHPNIVPVHDLGVDGEGRIYFTLKYVKGLSLKEVIRGRRDATQLEDKRKFRDVFSSRQMIEILISVCNAVAYAHSKDIIHRDLKPDNVMLGKFGEVLVMDWGLAKILSQHISPESASSEAFLDLNLRATLDSNMTMEGAIAGTPAYMSPEQAEGKISELDQRTDIYSLGSMLYEILSGEPPYKGATALEVVRMVTEGPPPPLSSGTYGFRPIPRELKAICEKAMAHDPKDRYVFGEQLRDDLQAYLEDQPVTACPDTALQKGVKWIKRNRQRVTATATTIIAVLAVIGGIWFGYRQYQVNKLLAAAQVQAQQGKKEYNSYKSSLEKLQSEDPYQAALRNVALGELANQYREKLNKGIDRARRALDISPDNARSRTFLAESYMELWRLALLENREALMQAYGAEVLRYAANPELYRQELEGLGSLQLTVDPSNADVYLFRYETLHATDARGNLLPPRLVPVPFDPATKQSDPDFLETESQRAAILTATPDSAHSIFRLDPTPASRIGSGNISVSGLPSGSYLLVALGGGRAETHVPFVVDRMAEINRNIVMPGPADVPSGFVYIDGGPTVLGGGETNARSRQQRSVKPFLLAQEELSMGDYAAFLASIGREAERRLPRDSNGKPLAAFSHDGFIPADGSDARKFAASAVRGVSYNDAMAYIAWRTTREGVTYRLPSEDEWESACRGADGRRYSWGNFPGQGLAISSPGGDLGAVSNWKWQSYKDESPWGVHNLAGGAAEWTNSNYTDKASDPNYGSRTIKGNAFGQQPEGFECAFRASGQPEYIHPTVGFRLAADWPAKRIAIAQPEVPAVEPIANNGVAQPPKPKPPKLSHSEEVLHKLGLDK